MDNFHSGNFGFATVVYLIFSFFSFFFVVKVYRALTKFRIGLKNKTKVLQTLLLISIISILYFIQAIFGFFALIGHNKLNDVTDKWYENNDNAYYVWIFFWFIITEISPIIAIFTIFHLSLKRTKKTMQVEIKILQEEKGEELLGVSDTTSDEY
ncbi:integral membrane protein [Anaeramoeba flamelloides]|nr:integral membrane protein [Anaeramoeba flamelloides]